MAERRNRLTAVSLTAFDAWRIGILFSGLIVGEPHEAVETISLQEDKKDVLLFGDVGAGGLDIYFLIEPHGFWRGFGGKEAAAGSAGLSQDAGDLLLGGNSPLQGLEGRGIENAIPS